MYILMYLHNFELLKVKSLFCLIYDVFMEHYINNFPFKKSILSLNIHMILGISRTVGTQYEMTHIIIT